MSGQVSYYAGLSAEEQVALHYQRHGLQIADQRWRGTGGEIDLIAQDGNALVFIEVKKSRSFAKAAERVSPRQMRRIYSAASEYLANAPQGQDTDCRFDVALVNGTGQIQILENAFAA